ncbi:winged helix-turn-helix transcriptional regulator [Solirubrobacter sp. CPCC 204708]|uniref:Winged helix-turn-helix domain-containing protein n=1 Tax=Solirubrobacter deserti TaxID=2282478 RepID=A0ABT4RQ25_9ACTN|nr:winged helix-turn-helix domain-containing protein [Solirubrobacter deserti]MBE2320625.1 winged helix-turn-helix transcriptional regulator [Solirubrobacter deserti]MDA0140679.1 winged helix-turn-helix domain-containing protein [Solirubrobacter deserti]
MPVDRFQPCQRVRLIDLDGAKLEPILSPMPTVVEAVRDLVGARRPAVLSAWQRRLLRRTMPRRTLSALTAFRPTSMASDGAPNPLLAAAPRASMREELERLAVTAPDELGLAIEHAAQAGRPTGPWMHLHRDPAGWLQDYLAGLRLIWSEVRPLWANAHDRLAREVEQLEAISGRGAGGQLAAVRALPGRIERGALVLPSHTEQSGRLTVSNSVQLVPLFADAPAGSWGDDYGQRLLSLRYALPPSRAPEAPERLAPDSLEALLGSARAAVLVALADARSPGALAERLFLTPSGVSHHLAALESAGLVTRMRQGRHVAIRRTARAVALLALYDRA